MLASDNELDRSYGEVYQAGCFVTEFGLGSSDVYLSAVGEMIILAEIEKRTGNEIDPQKLSMQDCMEVGAFPGTGKTRAESIRNALWQLQTITSANSV